MNNLYFDGINLKNLKKNQYFNVSIIFKRQIAISTATSKTLTITQQSLYVHLTICIFGPARKEQNN